MGEPGLVLGSQMTPLSSATVLCNLKELFPALCLSFPIWKIISAFQVSVCCSEILECCVEMCVLGIFIATLLVIVKNWKATDYQTVVANEGNEEELCVLM